MINDVLELEGTWTERDIGSEGKEWLSRLRIHDPVVASELFI